MNIQASILFVLTFLAKVMGFSRDLILSYYYGASNIVDAYVIATTIPMVVFSFVGTGIQTSLIPMLDKVDSEGGSKSEFIANIVNIFSIFCFLAIIVVLICTKPVVMLFASGFDGETMELAVSFTRFSISGIVFSTLTYIFTSVLHHKNRFIAAAFSIVLMDFIVLIFVVLSHFFGLYLLPVGNVAALGIQAIFLWCIVRYNHKIILDFRNSNFILLIQTIVPIIIGASVNQVNLLIDQTLASRIMIGAISYLNYANKVLAVVQGVFILAFISLVYPKMSQILIQRDFKKLNDSIKNWTIILEFFVIPCMIIFMLYSEEIINLLFFRGNFTRKDVGYTGMVLFIYAVQLPMYAVRELLVRVYYGERNSRLPLVNSVIGLAVNIIVALACIRTIGLAALPFSTTVSCFVTAGFLFVRYVKDFCLDESKKIIVPIIAASLVFLCTFLMIVCGIRWGVKEFLELGKYGYIFEMGFSFFIYAALFFFIRL